MTGPSIATVEVTAPASSLRDVLREALALGAAFRLSGAAVQNRTSPPCHNPSNKHCASIQAISGR
jgi:hypothetical protein